MKLRISLLLLLTFLIILTSCTNSENIQYTTNNTNSNNTYSINNNSNNNSTIINSFNPVVVFSFDDGTLDHYENAYPIFKKYNITGTSYIIAGMVGETFEGEPLMNWSQLREMYDYGWDIQSHSMTHKNLTLLNDTELEFELKQSKKLLNAMGFNVNSIAPPYGNFDERVRIKADEYYTTIRPSYQGYNTAIDTNSNGLRSQWVVNTTTLDEMKEWVTYAKDNKAVLIFMIHLVKDDLSREYTMTPENLEQIIVFIQEEGLEIKNLNELEGDLY